MLRVGLYVPGQRVIESDGIQRVTLSYCGAVFEIVPQLNGGLTFRNNAPLDESLIVMPHSSNLVYVTTARYDRLTKKEG